MPDRVFLATIVHNYGAAFFANKTEAGLSADLAKWCRDYWQQERIRGTVPDDAAEVIRRYFEESDDTLFRASEAETIGD